jgi:hypothetical protein
MTETPNTPAESDAAKMDGLGVTAFLMVGIGLLGIVLGFANTFETQPVLIAGAVVFAGGAVVGAVRGAAKAIIAGR